MDHNNILGNEWQTLSPSRRALKTRNRQVQLIWLFAREQDTWSNINISNTKELRRFKERIAPAKNDREETKKN